MPAETAPHRCTWKAWPSAGYALGDSDADADEARAVESAVARGEFGAGALMMEDAGPHCVDCADLGHLDYLPAGSAALTRRATKLTGVSAVVVRWSRSRKRYERQGILAEPEAIEQAEAERLTEGEERPATGQVRALRRPDGELHP